MDELLKSILDIGNQVYNSGMYISAILFIVAGVSFYIYGLLNRTLAIAAPVVAILFGYAGYIFGDLHGEETATYAYNQKIKQEQDNFTKKYLDFSNRLRTIEAEYNEKVQELNESASQDELRQAIIEATAPLLANKMENTNEETGRSCLLVDVPSNLVQHINKSRAGY